jgi:hypothetical protein
MIIIVESIALLSVETPKMAFHGHLFTHHYMPSSCLILVQYPAHFIQIWDKLLASSTVLFSGAVTFVTNITSVIVTVILLLLLLLHVVFSVRKWRFSIHSVII